MSADLDLSAMGPAVSEAATLIVDSLGLAAVAGDGFDLWAPDGADVSDLLTKGARSWSAPLLGPLGPCGEIALVLASGANVPGEGRVASGLAGCAAALSGVCGADHVGDMQRAEPSALVDSRPGQQAYAVPLVNKDGRTGLVVVISSSEMAAELPHLEPSPGPATGPRSIAALADVEMTVSVELGRTKIAIKDLLNVHNGAVVQLDRPVSHPVDIFVNSTLIARGEVVVVDEHFAVRVTELLTGD
ncbi:MAG TPA: flagellar motor switch protein FliN [Acidimicrobiales bacterium]|nr:flagellar motor switch protein FliN [Acidimicrobiales bacterium]